jgi:hypothetical protein
MSSSADLTSESVHFWIEAALDCVLSVTEWLVSKVATRTVTHTYMLTTANKTLPPFSTVYRISRHPLRKAGFPRNPVRETPVFRRRTDYKVGIRLLEQTIIEHDYRRTTGEVVVTSLSYLPANFLERPTRHSRKPKGCWASGTRLDSGTSLTYLHLVKLDSRLHGSRTLHRLPNRAITNQCYGD